MTDQFAELDNYNADPFSELDSYDPTLVSTKGGFINAAKNVAGSTLSGTGHVLKDIGLESVGNSAIAKGKEIQDNNPAAVNSLSDIAKNPGTWVAESAGGMAGQAGEALAGGVVGGYLGGGLGALTGPFAPVAIPALSAAGAYVGGNIPMLVQEYGSERDQQIKNGIDDKKRALAGAAATTAIENLGGFKPGGMAGQGKKIVSDLAGKTTKEAVKTLVKKGVKSGVSEGLEEIPQQYTGAYGGGTDIKDLNTTENAQDAAFGAAMAFPGGAMFGSVNTVSDHYKAKRNEALDQTASTGPLGNALASGGLANTDTFNPADGSITDSTAVDIAANSHASSYDQLFQQAESNYGLPAGLLSTMGFHESGFDPNAVSSAGARGVMQFMPATAQEYGIDPHDTPAAINAAGKKMSGLINYYKGDISKAIAAYNFGEGNVDKTIARAGDNWQDELPPETQVYLSRILGGQEATTTQANTNNQYNDNADQLNNFDQSNDQQTLSNDNNNSLASGLESINTLENPYLSTQAENQNGSQKTDESTNETSTQEKGSLLNTDAPEQSGVTPNLDALAEQLHTAIATDNSKQPDQHYADIVASNKLTPQQSDDLITKYQGIAEQVNNEQTNQQTETQAQDQTSADQGTAVTPSYATAPLLNKRTNKPFKTRKMAEAAIASSSNPTLNKQDHIAVPVDGGFGIAPKPNTTQESNDTTAETQSVLSNTGTNAKGITAPATTDATGQGSTQTAQEVDKQPWQMTHDEYWKAEDKKYEANRLERLAKVNNELDTLKNKGEGYDAIIAKEIGKVPHTITNDGKFSHNLRSGSYKHNNAHEFVVRQLLKRRKSIESSSGRFRNSFVNDNKNHHAAIQKAINEGQSIPKNVLESLPSNFPEFKIDAKAQATETVAPEQKVTKKPDWEMTRDEYKNSFDPRDYKDSNYDKMIHAAVFNEKLTQAEADKKLIRDYLGNKYHWAKTRKELEQDKKEAVKNAKAARAEGNKNPIHSVKWAQKSESNTAKNNITSTNLYHNKLLEVHQERVQEALSEGKSVPQEVLADYPGLQKPVQETANPIRDTTDVSKKGENVDTAKPEWHIDIPEHGLAILPAELKGEGYRTVAGRIAKDAVEAITQNQKIANDTLYLYFLPAAENYNAIARYFPEDQKPGSPWQISDSQGVRVGSLTNDQLLYKTESILGNKPILGWEKTSTNAVNVIGKGNSGDVTRIDNEVEKNATGNEAKVYELLKGVEGVAKGYEHDGKIRLPFYEHIISIDTIPKDDRESLGSLVSKNKDRIISAVNSLTNIGYDYNDPLQFGMNKDQQFDLLDFSMAENNFPKEVRNNNLNRLSSFFKQFGAEKIGKAISHVANVLTEQKFQAQYPDMAYTTHEGIDYPALTERLGGKVATHAYYATNARYIQLKDTGIAQTELVNGIKVILSNHAISESDIKQWEMTSVVYGSTTKQEKVAQAVKPALGKYIQSKATASAEDQKRLANRGSRIATLSSLNEAVRNSNPDYAYSDSEIQSAADDKIDAGIDWLISKQKPTEKLTTKGAVIADKAENIQDLGEKIGGARKDTSNKTGATGTKKAVDDRPTWAKRFSITELTQVGGLDQADDGKWIIRDNKSKDWTGQARTLATFDTEQEAKDALPLLAVAIKHRVTTGSKNENGDYNYEIWRNINERKRVKVVDKSFKTHEEAMQYMAQHAQAILETNTTFGESDLPVPENKQRTGKAHRDGDVNGESFMHTFGIRGVEFGNWNNQDERQEVMNAAYDGLMDLSEVLSIPPAAIGLNGELALAFGARGAGLSSAKAHYELQKSVINLTKMNGAGALAHEWLHALDHYLGRLDGKADANWVVAADGTRSFKVTTAEDSFVSSGFKRNSGVREELRNAFKHVMDTIFHKAEIYISDTKKADDFVAIAREDLAKYLDNLRKDLSQQKDIKYYKRNNKPASADQLLEFDTVASQLLNGDALDTQFVLNEKQTRRLGMAGRRTNEQLDKISAIYKAVRGRSGFDAAQDGVLDNIRRGMDRYDQRLKQLAFANSTEEKTKKVPTSFAMDAKELDQGRGGDYWTSAHEMAARAFQGYVEDKMAEQAGRNPFLNYAPANFMMLTPWGGKRVFPHGEERKAINAAFDKFVAILETKETEKGTALFSKSTTTVVNPHSKTTLNQAVTKAMDTLFGQGWTNRLMATGKFKMISAAEATGLIGKNAMFHKVWHGSPHDHNKFDSNYIDTGEGAQAFGWGHYFSDLKTVAEWYRDTLQKKQVKLLVDGKDVTELARRNSDSTEKWALGILLDELKYPNMGAKNGLSEDQIKKIIDKVILEQTPRSGENDPNYLKSLEKIRDYLTDLKNKKLEIGKGKLYEVDLAPKQDEYLDWDKPLSEQSDVVKAGLKELHKQLEGDLLNEYLDRINADWSELTGKDLYQKILQRSHQDGLFDHPDIYDRSVPDDEASSHLLHSLGIRGIRYQAEQGKSDANNYVVFNDADVKIEVKYSKNGDVIAFYNPANDTTYLVHDNITKNTSDKALQGLMLHEIGVHALTLGKSNEVFKDILRRFEALKKTNPKVQAAFDRVPKDTKSEDIVEEALAYYLEENPRSSLAQRIVEWFRQAVRALGKTLPVLERAKFSQWANKLTEAELIGMATSALKSAPDSLQFDNVGRNREGIKLSGDKKELLAPNGKPSNLNAMQHAQVRTEAFKKWFGDWETAQIIHELKNGKPFIVSGNEFADFSEPLNMKKLRSEAITYGESNIVGKYENKYSGIKLEVRRGGIDESIQHGSGPEKLKALASIKDILVNGYVVYDGINPKNKKGRLVAISKRVDISGKSFVVTVGLREDANGRLFYDHELLDTRRAEGLSSQSSEGLSPQHPAPTSTRLNNYYIRFIEKDTNSSKVVDENGEPLVVYHGTDKSFDLFDIEATAQNRAGNPTGIYLTPSKDEAKYFGSNVFNLFAIAANPYIEGESKVNQKMANTYAQILKDNYPNYGDDWIDNTIIPEFKKTGRFKDIKGAFKTRVMKAGGFDSWKDGRHIDVFGPNQIKSATENNGDFSLSNNNIKFSRSTPSNTPADNSAMRSFFAPAKGKQALGWLAGVFQRNHLIDFVAQDLPELVNYKLLSQAKDNFTNQREQEIAKSYQEMMDKLDKKTMHELGRVQGMATRLVKFDPALADDNTPMTEEELAVYDAYTAMPDSAKEVYATMRDAYQADLMEKKRALIERIKAFPADRETQAEIIRTIENHFDQFKEGVYFPLNRDGAVIVKATNADGDLVIEHVATQADAYKLIKEMQDQGYENTHILGKDAYDRDLLAGNAANEMAALAHRTISDLKEKSVQGKLTDADFNDLFSEFNQLLINTLPDSSYRKHFIHRKGTLGESTDTLRSYAKTRTSAVKMIASLTYDHQIQAVLNDADKTIKEMDKVPGSDTLAIKSILNELKLREAALKSTEINAMSQVLTSLAFMGALGFNIASAAVNMLQVVGVALPELIGRHGEANAIKEISAAYRLLFNPANLNKQSGFDITKNPNLPAITKQAIERLKAIGRIDLTMTHDAIAAGKNPSYSSNLMTRSLGSAAKYSGYFFHVAEAANRQITGMAAFNLAYQKNGGNFEAAIAEAVDVIDRTQFDYGQGNRARYMMSNTARVLTVFKAFALGMSYFIGRNAYQSMKGETPEVRLQARKTLVASMAMSFATAGLFGMPIGIEAFAGIGGVAAFKYKGAKFAVPGAIGGMLIFQALLAGLGADDEDELETEFRNWLTDNFDQTIAEWVTKGPARLLPIGDISGRTSLSELWWRSQNKQLEGTDQYNAIATALIGPIGSQIAGLFTAKKMYEDGQYSRMVESMSPAFLRNAIAANRMNQEGVRNLKGDKIIERDLTPVELINKVIGFNPTVVTNTYDANSAIAKESRKHTLAKSHLVNRWMSGDATERSDLMKGDIKDFNESVSPSERITLKNLFASMKARKGIDKHTQNGLYLSKKQNYLRDIGRFNRQE